MKGFRIKTNDGQTIRFNYLAEAPITAAAFAETLPFTRTFLHARVSGEEIWIDDAPEIDIIQENASVFISPGEAAIAPIKPVRSKVSKCMGIMYGEGRLLDCSNIFAKVLDEDLTALKRLGAKTWKEGVQELTFEAMND